MRERDRQRENKREIEEGVSVNGIKRDIACVIEREQERASEQGRTRERESELGSERKRKRERASESGRERQTVSERARMRECKREKKERQHTKRDMPGGTNTLTNRNEICLEGHTKSADNPI